MNIIEKTQSIYIEEKQTVNLNSKKSTNMMKKKFLLFGLDRPILLDERDIDPIVFCVFCFTLWFLFTLSQNNSATQSTISLFWTKMV